ncbi:hypothetical protein E2C01_068387 [Portunus trituberculatus]|uniref:Uncharacterized protein n=1 Tax=Portunus trituberculatus TaxID=210409 RepID=A0A5B7HRU7_PORTR|nr:hypothetical protein [Portunus trituberculatus]
MSASHCKPISSDKFPENKTSLVVNSVLSDRQANQQDNLQTTAAAAAAAAAGSAHTGKTPVTTHTHPYW